jgi:hypothetical protein
MRAGIVSFFMARRKLSLRKISQSIVVQADEFRFRKLHYSNDKYRAIGQKIIVTSFVI